MEYRACLRITQEFAESSSLPSHRLRPLPLAGWPRTREPGAILCERARLWRESDMGGTRFRNNTVYTPLFRVRARDHRLTSAAPNPLLSSPILDYHANL